MCKVDSSTIDHFSFTLQNEVISLFFLMCRKASRTMRLLHPTNSTFILNVTQPNVLGFIKYRHTFRVTHDVFIQTKNNRQQTVKTKSSMKLAYKCANIKNEFTVT